MTTAPPKEFFALSSLLTGFSEQTLQFAQQSADFYGEFVKIHDSAADDLLGLYRTGLASGQTPDDIARGILDDEADKAVADTARALIVFWYLGQIAPPGGDAAIPSANIYAEGLAWRAIQAHPTGVSHQKFGYWATLPAPLDDFL